MQSTTKIDYIAELVKEMMKEPLPSLTDLYRPQPVNIYPQLSEPLGFKSTESMLAHVKRVNAEREERRKQELADRLGKDNLFRFGYIPFVIGELAWDYADTIMDLVCIMRLSATRKLCRAIRNIRADFKKYHNTYIDEQHSESELKNMYVFEEGVKDIFKTYLLNLKLDLRKEHPDLSAESVDYLTAVYQCLLVLKSLFLYADRQRSKVAKIVGHPIGDIIPKHLHILADLVAEFVGDSPASKTFEKLQKTYIEIIANQIALIELTDTK